MFYSLYIKYIRIERKIYRKPYMNKKNGKKVF